MELTFKHNGNSYRFNTDQALDISLPIKRDGTGVTCFYTDRPMYNPYQAGSFIGSVNSGGACNVDVIRFTPHGNGTHTECIGHINGEGRLITETLNDSLMLCNLISIEPEIIGEDQCITRQQLEQHAMVSGIKGLVVRTLPNTDAKRSKDYSGTNPVYFSAEALEFVKNKGIEHLLCDFPSVDREEDGGKLLAHKAFFGVPESPRLHATITELIYVSEKIEDGFYMLNIQIASFHSDASPSRPLLYRVHSL